MFKYFECLVFGQLPYYLVLIKIGYIINFRFLPNSGPTWEFDKLQQVRLSRATLKFHVKVFLLFILESNISIQWSSKRGDHYPKPKFLGPNKSLLKNLRVQNVWVPKRQIMMYDNDRGVKAWILV